MIKGRSDWRLRGWLISQLCLDNVTISQRHLKCLCNQLRSFHIFAINFICVPTALRLNFCSPDGILKCGRHQPIRRLSPLGVNDSTHCTEIFAS